MSSDIKKVRNFRIDLSKEKIKISDIMLAKGMYNDSIISSYLSIFYSVRVFLTENNIDSDDHSQIIELAKKYFEPSGWENIDIVGMLKESKEYNDKIKNLKGIKSTREDADRINQNAKTILNEVLKKYSNSSQ